MRNLWEYKLVLQVELKRASLLNSTCKEKYPTKDSLNKT